MDVWETIRHSPESRILPRHGWYCVNVIDLREDDELADETDYATCQICGKEEIRYVHIMEHPDLDEIFEVGCICAGKMTEDFYGPKARETKLRNRAARRTRWLRRHWRVSAKGNQFLNAEGHNLVVYRTKNGRWGYKIGDRFSSRTYPTTIAAKLALFDDFWNATQGEDWLWIS